MHQLKIVECPRDAMQGFPTFIPTESKIRLINMLLKVGFDTIDFGSFVSPRLIPQLRDTAQVLEGLDLSSTSTKLLAIVANYTGAKRAARYEQIRYLGYPISVSETFQKKNTNKEISQAFEEISKIQDLLSKGEQELVAYVSMGFGNPYGEVWNTELVSAHCERLVQLGIKTISLSDTIGIATPESITALYEALIPRYPQVEFGAHMHTRPDNWRAQIDAAYQAGCRRFDSAISGRGGCPFAMDELVGNLPTEKLLTYLNENKIKHSIRTMTFESAYNEAKRAFMEN